MTVEHERTNLEALYDLPQGWHLLAQTIEQDMVTLEVQLNWHATACACNGVMPRRHARRSRTYRLPPLFERQVLAVVTFQTYQCADCGRSHAPEMPRGKFSPAFEELIGREGLTTSSSEISERYSVERTSATRMIQKFADGQLSKRVVQPPVVLGIDNCMLAGDQRTVLVDIDRRLHLDVLDDLKEGTVIQALRGQSEEWKPTLQAVVIDQSEVFRRAVLAALPGVPIVLDRFHVAMSINQAFARFANDYRAEHAKAGAKRLPPSAVQLRATNSAKVLKRYEALQGEWGELAEAFWHARQWQRMYESQTEAEARAAWLQWANSIPVVLVGELGPVVQRLTRNWLSELCAGVRVREDLGWLPTNGVTEALNKRSQRIDLLTNTTLPLARARLLLMRPSEERQRLSKARRHEIERGAKSKTSKK